MAHRTDTIGRAGEHYVAAELNRRGAYASPFSGNVPGIDIVATDSEQNRMVYIQVRASKPSDLQSTAGELPLGTDGRYPRMRSAFALIPATLLAAISEATVAKSQPIRIILTC